MFSRGNSRRTTAEEQLLQETNDNDYSDFSTKGASSCFGFPLWKCSYCILPYPFRFSPEERTTRSRNWERWGKKRRVQPPNARLTPTGHGENGILPTINSPLPLFLTLAVWPKGCLRRRERWVCRRRRDRNEIGKGARGIPSRVYFSPYSRFLA